MKTAKYVIHHVIDGEKTSVFHTDDSFLEFAKLIARENEDIEPESASAAVQYIHTFCPNLELTLDVEMCSKDDIARVIYVYASTNDYHRYENKISFQEYVKQWVKDNFPFSA